MEQEALTDLAIKGMKPTADRYEVFDTKVPGFGVRVFPSGIKSFMVFYRQKGRLRRLTLGRYPILSLAEARRLAQASLNRVAHGSDPQQDKDDSRRGFAFAAAVETFVRTHCLRHNRANTAHETARILRSHFIRRWGNRDLREISRSDIVTVLDRIVDDGSPSAANHALAAIRKFFNWSVERGMLDASPCMNVKKPTPHRSRDRVLADDELLAIWRAADQLGWPYCPIIKLLILTAQRRGEVTDMRWSEIDLERGVWSIPAERTKSNRAQILPLVPAAVKLIAALPKLDESFVFPAQGNTGRSFSGFSKCKRRLEELAGATGWTVHDLRRTGATGMARLGVAPHVVERILNHTSGTLGGVAGVYNRFGYQPEMLAALELWAAHVIDGAEGNMVER